MYLTAKQHQINGKITIHGKTKKINCVGFLKKIDNPLELVTSVIRNTADFNIKIPAIVDNKISKTVNVTPSCVLQYTYFVKQSLNATSKFLNLN